MSPNEYLEWLSEFAQLWQGDHSFMALISANQQYDLHAYLEFHRDKSDEEALSWLLAIQSSEPELEELALDAGTDLASAMSRLNELTDQSPLPFTAQDYRRAGIKINSIVLPEPRVDLYIKAILELMREQGHL